MSDIVERLRQHRTRQHLSCSDASIALCDEAAAEIERLRTLLRHAKEKLQIYRREHSGEYAGGMEYSALISEINRSLEGT